MKYLILLFIALPAFAANKDACLKGDLKECSEVLKGLYSSKDSTKFEATFNEVCEKLATSASCTVRKIETVGADIEMKKAAKEQPKGYVWAVPKGKDSMIYQISPK